MQTKHRNRYLVSGALVVAIHILGRWLMSIYGLDPPYIYFNVGMLLYLGSIFAGIALALAIFVHVIRHSSGKGV